MNSKKVVAILLVLTLFFQFTPISFAANSTLPLSVKINISSKAYEKMMNVHTIEAAKDVKDFTRLSTWDATGSDTQIFKIVQKDDAYYIYLNGTDKVVDIYNATSNVAKSGSKCQMYTKNEVERDQLFKFINVGDSFKIVLNANTDLALTVAKDGFIYLQEYAGLDSQLWNIKNLEEPTVQTTNKYFVRQVNSKGEFDYNGCSIACLAMVFSNINQKGIQFDEVLAANGSHSAAWGQVGSSFNCVRDSANEINSKTLGGLSADGKYNKIYELAKSIPQGVILQFTGKNAKVSGLHYVVAYVDSNGVLRINDPSSEIGNLLLKDTWLATGKYSSYENMMKDLTYVIVYKAK